MARVVVMKDSMSTTTVTVHAAICSTWNGRWKPCVRGGFVRHESSFTVTWPWMHGTAWWWPSWEADALRVCDAFRSTAGGGAGTGAPLLCAPLFLLGCFAGVGVACGGAESPRTEVICRLSSRPPWFLVARGESSSKGDDDRSAGLRSDGATSANSSSLAGEYDPGSSSVRSRGAGGDAWDRDPPGVPTGDPWLADSADRSSCLTSTPDVVCMCGDRAPSSSSSPSLFTRRGGGRAGVDGPP
mmetsp:Transcript_5952/g.18797  ORF Transcript_5952/g.18797 Transcript_5952/m.18797 type:complete len:242 (-) Transcript_5952:157-882(-)